MGMQTAHVPVALAPSIMDQDFSQVSLYSVFSSRFGLVPAAAHEIHYAILIEAEDAQTLGVREGTAGLAGERTTFLSSGRPLEFVYSLMRGDRYQIVLDLVSRQMHQP
jgi:GntR family transcriptional regulator